LNFGTEPKKTLEFGSDTPAAGTYSPIPQLTSPSFTIGKRLDNKTGNGVPGPGTYNSDKRDGSPAMKIGTSLRFIKSFSEKEELEKPGPGNYDPANDNLKCNFFIAKAKKDDTKIPLGPGPGQYNVV
jgi:hypothetical protein